MCNHHWLIERRSTDDWDGWEPLDRVEGWGERARERALELAQLHALADPARAREIHIARYDCNGEPMDPTRPFPTNLPAPWLLDEEPAPPAVTVEHASALARENIRLRAALSFYSRPGLWAMRVSVDDEGVAAARCNALADRGATARAALEGRS